MTHVSESQVGGRGRTFCSSPYYSRFMRARVSHLLAGLSLAGCVLFVPAAEIRDHCRVSGGESACGRCAIARCQAQIDTCCGQPACGEALAHLEACASRRDVACDELTGGASSQDKTVLGLAGCVATRCAGDCAAVSGPSRTHCAEPYLADGVACSCTLSDTPNQFVCAESNFPRTICCSPQGWPAQGLECSCLPIGCNPTADGCLCTRVDYSLAGLATECEGPHCCAADDSCACRARPCESWQREVKSCALGELRCPSGQLSVQTCSP